MKRVLILLYNVYIAFCREDIDALSVFPSSMVYYKASK
jgi:hypothetical protein